MSIMLSSSRSYPRGLVAQLIRCFMLRASGIHDSWFRAREAGLMADHDTWFEAKTGEQLWCKHGHHRPQMAHAQERSAALVQCTSKPARNLELAS